MSVVSRKVLGEIGPGSGVWGDSSTWGCFYLRYFPFNSAFMVPPPGWSYPTGWPFADGGYGFGTLASLFERRERRLLLATTTEEQLNNAATRTNGEKRALAPQLTTNRATFRIRTSLADVTDDIKAKLTASVTSLNVRLAINMAINMKAFGAGALPMLDVVTLSMTITAALPVVSAPEVVFMSMTPAPSSRRLQESDPPHALQELEGTGTGTRRRRLQDEVLWTPGGDDSSGGGDEVLWTPGGDDSSGSEDASSSSSEDSSSSSSSSSGDDSETLWIPGGGDTLDSSGDSETLWTPGGSDSESSDGGGETLWTPGTSISSTDDGDTLWSSSSGSGEEEPVSVQWTNNWEEVL